MATLEVGPQGGNLGDQYWTFEPADLGKITTFCISFSGDNIYSIQLTYNNQEGKPKDSKVYGVPGGAPSKFSLAKDETITLISGTKSHTLSITSLIFTTSKGHTHKYGDGGGTEFRVPVNRKIIGFKGSYVDSLTDLDVIV